SVLGKPLRCDAPTHNRSKLSLARVLIEVDLVTTLPDLITVQLPNGSILGQRVIYESLPRYYRSCASMGHSATSCQNGSSKRKPSSSESHTDHSSPSVMPPTEPQHPPGSCSLGVPMVPPQAKISNSPTFRRQSSPGRKRHKTFSVNTMPPLVFPGQTSHGILASWHFLNCSSAPPDTQQYKSQLKSSYELAPT
ncbi:hypothetical protein NC653_031976, partial [Populus alba x Populus x berolinensis]